MNKKPILYDVKITTGIAIILVVVGHLASRGQEGIDLYVNLKKVIYKFHMPLFLFLSGYIAFYTYKKVESFQDYYSLIKKKVKRLLPAYIILSLVFLIGKMIFVESTDVVLGLVDILLYPSKGSSGFLWYIYVLFLYNLTLPLISYILDKSYYFYFIFVASLFISSFVDLPQVLSLDIYFWYLPFFLFGCYLSIRQQEFIAFLKKMGIIFFIGFFVWGFLEFFEIIHLHKNIASFVAIFGISYLSSVLIKRQSLFEKIGDNSFYIYLFNTMFIGAISLFLIKFLGKDSFYNNFYYLAPILVFSGIIFPILLHKYLISKVPILKDWIK